MRFIPTPVGNTAHVSAGNLCSPVHPHARGEHDLLAKLPPVIAGSSPRPWGTLRAHRWPDTHNRFIPTPVGNTPFSSFLT